MLNVLFSTSLLILGSPTDPIVCPNWLPGTNSILPVGVTLSPGLRLENKVRCYCEIVLPKQEECIRQRFPRSSCVKRTKDWVAKSFLLKEDINNTNLRMTLHPARVPRMVNVDP